MESKLRLYASSNAVLYNITVPAPVGISSAPPPPTGGIFGGRISLAAHMDVIQTIGDSTDRGCLCNQEQGGRGGSRIIGILEFKIKI
jgi:hypothetical protein